jgi:hypothetical protein
MKPHRLVVALSVLLLASSASVATDLAKIDRIIKKEPTYKERLKYCLLVFGPNARTKVWLVLDGDTLYVDKNGNSDLTDPERVRPGDFKNVVISVPQENPPMERHFEIGNILKHRALTLSHRRWQGENHYSASVLINGKHEQVAPIPFAEKPAKAPIAYFDGPLTLTFYGGAPSLTAGASSNLSIAVGTRGMGISTIMDYTRIPENVFPVAEFEFPNKERVKVVLNHRC